MSRLSKHLCWKCEVNGGAIAWFTVNPNRSVVGFNDFLGQGQTDAATKPGFPVWCFSLIKPIKNMGKVFWMNTWPFVFDRNRGDVCLQVVMKREGN